MLREGKIRITRRGNDAIQKEKGYDTPSKEIDYCNFKLLFRSVYTKTIEPKYEQNMGQAKEMHEKMKGLHE